MNWVSLINFNLFRRILGFKPETLKILEETYTSIVKLFNTAPKDITFNTPYNNAQSDQNISFAIIDHLYEIFHWFSNIKKDK